MNLQEEKIDLVRLLLDTDDKNLIQEIKGIFEAYKSKENTELRGFYENFRESVREIKQYQDGKNPLKDAKDWLNEI